MDHPGSVFSYPDYAALRDQNNVFDGLIAWGGITASLNSNDQTDLVNGAIVSGNFFEVLGVRAQLGRVIYDRRRQDSRRASRRGDQSGSVADDVLPAIQTSSGGSYCSTEMLLPSSACCPLVLMACSSASIRDLYVPMMMQATMRPPRAGYSGEMNPDLLQVRGNRWLFSVGRLKPGVTAAQAQSFARRHRKTTRRSLPTNKSQSRRFDLCVQ